MTKLVTKECTAKGFGGDRKATESGNHNHFKGEDNPLLQRCAENASLFSAMMELRPMPYQGRRPWTLQGDFIP